MYNAGMLKKEMVGTWGLEPQTFPAGRDALTNLLSDFVSEKKW
jgi:hypothetical protein